MSDDDSVRLWWRTAVEVFEECGRSKVLVVLFFVEVMRPVFLVLKLGAGGG